MTRGTLRGGADPTGVDASLGVLAQELRVLRGNAACETAMLEMYVMERIDELLDRRLVRSAAGGRAAG